MAQKVDVTLIDDLDGSPATETVQFAIDGRSYEIDLNAKNAKALRAAFDKFIPNARRQVNGRRTPQGRKAERGYDLAQLREWAAKKKIDVPARGRISQATVDQYLKEGGK